MDFSDLHRAFAVTGDLEPTPTGGHTFHNGRQVFKYAENPTEARFLAEVYRDLPEEGFRVPRPLKTLGGEWVSKEGWTGWTFVKGRPTRKEDLPEVLSALQLFHGALKDHPMPDFLPSRTSLFDDADRAVWEKGPPPILLPEVQPQVQALLERLEPVEGLTAQLIHGDLNPDNILIEKGLPPAIIDFSPYWRPPEFAVSVLAYWLGAYHPAPQVFEAFSGVCHFDQMLLRVALRSLYIINTLAAGQEDQSALCKMYEPATRRVLEHLDRKLA